MGKTALIRNQSDTDVGPYDLLYESCEYLWPNRPGRMVKLASEIKLPERTLDLGCGDGKNLYFLHSLGCAADGVDISELAISRANRRLSALGEKRRGSLSCVDACCFDMGCNIYDLIICYGLYHCLNDIQSQHLHRKIVRSLKPGGIVALAVFNDDLPLPPNHHTPKITLRSRMHFIQQSAPLRPIHLEFGEIIEDHLPLVPQHRHSVTWALLQKDI